MQLKSLQLEVLLVHYNRIDIYLMPASVPARVQATQELLDLGLLEKEPEFGTSTLISSKGVEHVRRILDGLPEVQ